MRIDLGDSWYLDGGGRLIHECGPDVRAIWRGSFAECACGARLSRPARRFPYWLSSQVQHARGPHRHSDAA